MTRKSVPFSVPGAGRGESRPGPRLIEARSDEWVSDRNSGDAAPLAASAFVVDLAAERSLVETVALCMLAPALIGWFWVLRAMSGQPRF